MPQDTPPRAVQTAAAALRARRPGDALAVLGPDPRGRDALYLRALALSALGRTGEAEPAFEAAARAGAPLGELRMNQANMRRRAGDHEAALAGYDAAAAATPPPPAAPLATGRGAALAALGRLPEARAAYEAALAASPDDHAALTGLGGVLNRLREPEAAARLLDRALAGRRTAPALNNRASSARQLGQLTEELALLREAASLAPADPDVLANRARAAARAGQKAEAISGFVAAIGADPLRADTQRDLARYLFEAGEPEHMLRGYDAVPEGAPARAALLSDAAGLALRAGQRDAARDRYARALALAPRHPGALAGLAEAQGGAARAQGWARAWSAAPGDPGVRLGYAWHLLRDQDAPEEAERVLDWPAPPEHAQTRLAYDGVAARLLGRDRYEAVHDAHRLAGTRQIAPPPGETLAGFLAAVEDALAGHFSGDGAPVDQTLFGGEQSRGDLWATRHPTLAALKAAMLDAARGFRDDLDVPEGHPARGAPGPLTCGAAWSVRLRSGGGHRDHVHPRGTLSSAHYVRLPGAMAPAGEEGECPGWLRLGRPSLDRSDLPATRYVEPEPGLIALFPSYLWHGVEPFTAEGVRVTTPADFVAGPPRL